MTIKRAWVIGRAPDCELVVSHPVVSARHCELVWAEQGWYVKDLGSRNGTFVRGEQIPPEQMVPVEPGEEVLLAGSVPMPWPALLPGAAVQPHGSGSSFGESARANPMTAAKASPTTAPGSEPALPRGPRVPTLSGPGPGVVSLIRVGRAPDNDVVLENPEVSRYHARLTRTRYGWFLEDLGSRNGTAVGDLNNRVQQQHVTENDLIYLGTLRVPVGWLIQQAQNKRLGFQVGERMVLGRAAGAGFDPWVARQAAQLVRQGNQIVVQPLGRPGGAYVNGQPLVSPVTLQPGDEVQVGTNLFRLGSDGQLQQHSYRGRLIIEAREVGVCAGKKWLIHGVSLVLFPRELAALMGPSGAGKTTLLMALCGYCRPHQGDVLFNGESLYKNYERFSPFLGYVPQEDIMHRELTVREALYYSARLRLPADYSDEEIYRRIDIVVKQLGLQGCEEVLIGSPEKKGISGGQRKRVNLAMELLTDPLVLFLDEPTSGLSSEDARRVVELLRKLADQDKIIIVTIHQPGLETYRLFDSLILVAKDGNSPLPGQLVYYGPAYPDGILFFSKRGVLSESNQDVHPDNIMRGLARESAEAWALTYRNSEYYRRYVENRRLENAHLPIASGHTSHRLRPPGWLQLWTLVRRCLRVKLRDSWNTTILLAQAPTIALLIVVVFGQQAASNNVHEVLQAKPLTLFVTALAALWFGCSNAVREIVGEWAIYRRERMVGLALWPYVVSKVILLGSLCLLQCLILLMVNRLGCDWRSGALPQYALLVLVAFVGLALGLILSALARTSEVALALLPLVLLPMVVLGGAMMPIHKMPAPIRVLAQLMPTRWAYEGLVVLEAEAYPIQNPPPADNNAVNPAQLAPQPAQLVAAKVTPSPSQKIDLAQRHFPEDQRHTAAECMVALAVLFCLAVGAIFAILRYRDII